MNKEYTKLLRGLYDKFTSKGKPLDSFVKAELADQDWDIDTIESDLEKMRDEEDDEEEIEIPVKKPLQKQRSVTETQKTYSFKLSTEMMEELREKAWESRTSMVKLLSQYIQAGLNS
jgi:uncharacterized protein (DUF4415 family)